jgi:hypothetical protein
VNLIDMHVHLVALPEAENGCYMSPRMLRRPFIRFSAWMQGLDLKEPARTNLAYVERLLNELRDSKKVSQAVLLGTDGVYDEEGQLDLSQTDFLISNRHVSQVIKRHRDF